MKTLRILTIQILILSLFSACAEAQTKKKNTTNKSKPAATKTVKNTQTPSQVFLILAGNYSGNVEEPLIYVARDAETYELLKKVVPELPPKEQVDFKNSAIVGAFLGTTPTAGFEVEFKKGANGTIKVEKIDVPEGAMVAQVLTTPFKVALVPLDEETGLSLEIGFHWKKAMQTFRVQSGEFMFSGGFAGTQKKFNLGGTIGLMRVGDLVTVDFNVNGKGAETARKMDEIASGSIEGDAVTINRIEAGNLVDPPHPPVNATGTLKEKSLSLIFKSLPTTFADGYQGEGKLTASK